MPMIPENLADDYLAFWDDTLSDNDRCRRHRNACQHLTLEQQNELLNLAIDKGYVKITLNTKSKRKHLFIANIG
jgi:hypothetical protein